MGLSDEVFGLALGGDLIQNMDLSTALSHHLQAVTDLKLSGSRFGVKTSCFFKVIISLGTKLFQVWG